MLDEKIEKSIHIIEAYFFKELDENKNKFGESIDCGEKLFIDFAKKYKNEFLNSKLTESTENKFE